MLQCVFNLRSLAIIALWFYLHPAHAASFRGLGFVQGSSHSEALGTSPDGNVVVGSANFGGEAFRWTGELGISSLGDLQGGLHFAEAFDANVDGSVVAGHAESESGSEAFIWTPRGGMIGLGDLPGGPFGSAAFALSDDGKVVVGFGNELRGQFQSEAIRWTESAGMIGLGFLPGGTNFSQATSVSSNGGVVAGFSSSSNGPQAFRWTEANGMVGLGHLGGDFIASSAWGLSSDGEVIVGQSISLNGFEAFRWKADQGMIALGDLAGGTFDSIALATTADGGVVVGESKVGFPDQRAAFIWDAKNGMRELSTVLARDFSLSETLAGWQLHRATAISNDGRIIVGYGRNPEGNVEAWMALIPEPHTVNLLAFGLLTSSFCAILRRS